jgi:hypothetical protein
MVTPRTKTFVIAGTIVMLLLSGGLLWLRRTTALPGPEATQPGATGNQFTIAATDRRVVPTFAPMAGEWAGTYEVRSNDQERGTRRYVTAQIRTTDEGLGCEFDMQVLDRSEQPGASLHFRQRVNSSGDRVLLTAGPARPAVALEAIVTDTIFTEAGPRGALEWSTAFAVVGAGGTRSTRGRWARTGEVLTITREEVLESPEAFSRTSTEIILRPRTNKSWTALNALPRGSQTFDGVTFVIGKPLNLVGSRAASRGGRTLARSSDPTVQGRGRLIHVLHTGDHGASSTGDYIWRLVLHYADGESERFDFAYDVHLRNFWRRPDDGPPVPSDPNTSLPWIGSSVESDRTETELVVSRTTLVNPKPGVEVVGADYVSLLGPSSAYILAVTVGDTGPSPVPQQRKVAGDVSLLTFVLQNAAGEPFPAAVLNGEFHCRDFKVRWNEARADSKGRVVLDVPTASVFAVHYQASHPGGKLETGTIEVSPEVREWPPQVIRFPE